jgi:hypothetical protein
MTRTRRLVAEHVDRLRAAGGRRTSVELDAQAVEDLDFLRARYDPKGSISSTIAAALRVARLSLKGKK